MTLRFLALGVFELVSEFWLVSQSCVLFVVLHLVLELGHEVCLDEGAVDFVELHDFAIT